MTIPSYVDYVMLHLEENGHRAFLVGGSIRDLLNNKRLNEVHDFDIVTTATPEQVGNLFKKVISTGEKFGTVTVIVRGESVEVTTLRKDGAYCDHMHPSEVVFTNQLEEDLARRDFTMNAVAMDYDGNIYDPFGGIKDLSDGLIRAVGNPNQRFEEDPLRMMRAVRFVCTMGFDIEDETWAALSQNSSQIDHVSQERIKDELCKILMSPNPSLGVSILGTSGLLSYILPELANCVGVAQNNPYHTLGVYSHTIEVLSNLGPTSSNLNLRLAALFHDIGKPDTKTTDEQGIDHFKGHNVRSAEIAEEVMKRLTFSNETIDAVCRIVREHMTFNDEVSPRNIRRLIPRVGAENIEDLFELQIADIKSCTDPSRIEIVKEKRELARQILSEKQPLTVKDLAVNGYDLMALGIPQGPKIGEALQQLLDIVLDNPGLNTREYLLNKVSLAINCKGELTSIE